jgi:hypothetical protein
MIKSLFFLLISFNLFCQSTTSDSTLNKSRYSTVIRYSVGAGLLSAFKSKNFENGTGGNLFIEVRSTTPISIKANFGWYSADTRVEYLSKGNSSFFFGELSLLLRAKTGILQPFGGLGLGFYSIENTLDDEVVQFFNQLGYGVKEEIQSGAGWHFRGGFDLLFESNFGVSIEMKYWRYNPEAVSTVYPIQQPSDETTTSKEIELSNLNLVIGVFMVL